MVPPEPSFADRDGTIWMDGELVPWREATTHVLTHTLHYGVGVFEGIRAYLTPAGPSIFRLEDHTRRLYDSAKIMRMEIPFEYEELCEAQKTVLLAYLPLRKGYDMLLNRMSDLERKWLDMREGEKRG